MRDFSYYTVGKILKELREEGMRLGRATFYRMEFKFPKGRTMGKWRVYSLAEVKEIKDIIKTNYKQGSSKPTLQWWKDNGDWKDRELDTIWCQGVMKMCGGEIDKYELLNRIEAQIEKLLLRKLGESNSSEKII